MRLLVTRPEPDVRRSAAALRALGHDVVCAPMLRIETVADASVAGGPWDAVVITSAKAARAIGTHPRRDDIVARPVFAVGWRSAEAAYAAGFTEVSSCDGDMAALAGMLAAKFGRTSARCLYLAGEDRAGDLAGALAPHGIAVDTVVVYAAHAARAFPTDVAAALAAGTIDGVLHYSPRSARIYLDVARASGLEREALSVVQYCLSGAVAGPLAAASARTIRIANHPDEQSLFRLLDTGS